jgi:hypothetical protein
MTNDNFTLRRNELERLSAVETLKGLSNPGDVKLAELVGFLESRDLWAQFSKITLGDLRDAFGKLQQQQQPVEPAADSPRKRKRRILEDALSGPGDDETGDEEADGERKAKAPVDGGLETDEVARMVLPFVEGNDEVTLDDIAEYTRLDRKVLRHHLAVLCKEGRLERIGVGRHAIYSAVG